MMDPEPEVWVPFQASYTNYTMFFLFFGPSCSGVGGRKCFYEVDQTRADISGKLTRFLETSLERENLPVVLRPGKNRPKYRPA